MTRFSRLGFRRLGSVRLLLAALAVAALLLQTMVAPQAMARDGGLPGVAICGVHGGAGSAPGRQKALCHERCLLCAGHVLALGTPPPFVTLWQAWPGAAPVPAAVAAQSDGGARYSSYISRAPPQAG